MPHFFPENLRCGIFLSSFLFLQISHLIGLLALRLWPQQWSDLLPNLDTLWQRGGKQREVATRCLLSLAEEVSIHSYITSAPHEKGNTAVGVGIHSGRWDSMQIASARKQEVLKAFEAASPRIVFLVNTYLGENYLQIQATEELDVQTELSVQLLGKVALFVEFQEMLRTNVTGWVRLVTHPATGMQIVDILIDIFDALKLDDKKPGFLETLKFVDDLLNYLLRYLQGDCQMLANDPSITVEMTDVPEKLVLTQRFSLKLSDLFLAIANNTSMLNKLCKIDKVQATLSMLAAQMVTHPSTLMQLNAINFVKRLLNNEDIVKYLVGVGDAFFLPVLTFVNRVHLTKPTLLKKAVVSAKQLGSSDVDPNGHLDAMTCIMLVGEFEEQEEGMILHHAHLASAHRELAVIINRVYPAGFLQHLVNTMTFVLNNAQEYLPKENTPRNPITKNIMHETKLYLYWTMMETSCMHFTDSLHVDSMQIDAKLFAELEQILGHYITFEITDGLVLARYLGLLQCMAQILAKVSVHNGRPNAILSKVLGKLVSCMGYRLPAETGPIMSLDTISCRRKVQTVLLNLCMTYGPLFPPHLPLLIQAWEELQANSTLTDQEVSLLTEAVTTVANCLPDAERGGVLYKIVDPVVPAWQGLESLYAQRDVFLRFIESILARGASNKEFEGARNTLRKCISVFQGVFRRSSCGGTENDTLRNLGILSRQLLSGVVQLIVALHWVWTPGVLGGESVALLTITSEEKEQATGGNVTRSSDLILKGDALTPSQKVFVGRQYVCQLRASAYALLGSLASFSLQSYAEYQGAVAALFNDDLRSIEVLQLKYFFSDFCTPLMLLTPAAHYTMLTEILKKVCSFLLMRQSQAWCEYDQKYKANREGGVFSKREGAKVTTDDAWAFKLLTDLTAEVSATFFHIANIGHGSRVQNTKLKRISRDSNEAALITATCTEMMREDAMLRPVLQLLTGCVMFPSTVSAVRAVEALLKLTPSIAARPSLLPELTQLLGSSIHRIASLQQQPASGNRDSQLVNYLINLVTELYPPLCFNSAEPGNMLVQLGVPTQVWKGV